MPRTLLEVEQENGEYRCHVDGEVHTGFDRIEINEHYIEGEFEIRCDDWGISLDTLGIIVWNE